MTAVQAGAVELRGREARAPGEAGRVETEPAEAEPAETEPGEARLEAAAVVGVASLGWALVAVLERDPVLHRAEVVADVQLARGLDAAEDTRHRSAS